LRALLRRAPQARPAILAAGDVRLDPATREVTVADDQVSLTPREYGLLEYLLRRPGQVITKIEILDHVWDAAAEVTPNVVEVYVGYLRRKLGRQLVETVRGAGYRLAP
jgi:DNA-binding response OmpR family regulator